MSDFQDVLYETRNGVAWITINRPERYNAFRMQTIDDLIGAFRKAWGDKEAYAVSHVGWGMNRGARWEAMTMYDKRDCNGTEQRAFAGNFLYSTGANEVAGRHTLGHYDLPLRHCTVTLDGKPVVADGVLQGDLA